MFSFVTKLVALKMLLKLAAAPNWILTKKWMLQMLFFFLQRDLDEEIYMSLPLGYTPPPGVNLPPNSVCKLKK